ncbi:MAG: flagellar biosynthesis repressor FlbT [Hyphomicrobiales bacterium]
MSRLGQSRRLRGWPFFANLKAKDVSKAVGMALKVDLKPGERIVIGEAVVQNGDTRCRLFIRGFAPILREKDVLPERKATTPAKRLYFVVQLMYLDDNVDVHLELYMRLYREFAKAVPSAIPLLEDINNHILSGDLYKSIKSAGKLVDYESELLDDESGTERIRKDSTYGDFPEAT